MSGAMTTLGCNAMINYAFGNADGTKSPTIMKLALFNKDPETDEPVEVSESGTNYARQDIKFTLSKECKISNSNTITYPAAKKSWGVITSVGVYANIKKNDAEENAEEELELIFTASLPQSKEVAANSVLSFAPGNIRFSLI